MAAKKTRKPRDADWLTQEEKVLRKRVWLPKQTDSLATLDKTVYDSRVGKPKYKQKHINPDPRKLRPAKPFDPTLPQWVKDAYVVKAKPKKRKPKKV